MAELAPLPLASAALPCWESAQIPATELTGLRILHIRVPSRHVFAEENLGFPKRQRISWNGDLESIWLGPGEWLVLSRAPDEQPLKEIGQEVAGLGGAVTQAQDRLLALELHASIQLLCGLTGLAKDNLALGCVARTRLADIPVIIAAAAAEKFHLLFDRTYAQHMRAWLDRAI
jgi:heterotetrameric sarcosine oxidase gamma subunit